MIKQFQRFIFFYTWYFLYTYKLICAPTRSLIFIWRKSATLSIEERSSILSAVVGMEPRSREQKASCINFLEGRSPNTSYTRVSHTKAIGGAMAFPSSLHASVSSVGKTKLSGKPKILATALGGHQKKSPQQSRARVAGRGYFHVPFLV